MNKKIVFFVNDSIFFQNHFCPIALESSKIFSVSIISNKINTKLLKLNPAIKQYTVEIKRSSVNPLKDLILFLEVSKILNKLRPDIIHNITIKPILYGSLYVKIFNSKTKIVNSITGLGYAITNNRILLTAIIKGLIKIFVTKKAHFLFLNKHDKEFYNMIGVLTDDNYSMINGSGVDKTDFTYRKPLDKEKIIIVFTGRILYDKGVYDLINAVKLLNKKFKDILILKIYGGIDIQNPAHIKESDLKGELIEDFIIWEGHTNKIKEVLSECDIYCLPSYREGNPKSIIEALAIGRPIITTKAPGCEDTVKEGVNGFKVKIGDIKEISSRIKNLINNKSLRIKMGKESRSIFEKNYSLDIVVKQFQDVYFRLMRL